MPLSEAHLAAKSMSKFATCQEVDTPEYPCLYVAFLLSVVQYPASLRHEKRQRDSQWHGNALAVRLTTRRASPPHGPLQRSTTSYLARPSPSHTDQLIHPLVAGALRVCRLFCARWERACFETFQHRGRAHSLKTICLTHTSRATSGALRISWSPRMEAMRRHCKPAGSLLSGFVGSVMENV
jgi:hypothetical protein